MMIIIKTLGTFSVAKGKGKYTLRQKVGNHRNKETKNHNGSLCQIELVLLTIVYSQHPELAKNTEKSRLNTVFR